MAFTIWPAAPQPFSEACRTSPAASSSLAWHSSYPLATWYVLDVIAVLDSAGVYDRSSVSSLIRWLAWPFVMDAASLAVRNSPSRRSSDLR